MPNHRVVAGLITAAISLTLLGLCSCTFLQPKVTVDFEASETQGTTPFIVEFTPLVAEDTAYYLWDFGDGQTSPDSSPVHVYRSGGSFDVSLTVGLISGPVLTTVKEELIQVTYMLKKDEPAPLYWLQGDVIKRGNRDGSASETLVRGIDNGMDLAVGCGYIFWTDGDTIYRANHDGIGKMAVASGQDGLVSLTVDEVAERL